MRELFLKNVFKIQSRTASAAQVKKTEDQHECLRCFGDSVRFYLKIMWTFHIRGYFHVCWSTSKAPSTLKPFWDPTSWRLLDRFFGVSKHILKPSFPFNYHTQILCTVCVDFLWLYSDQCVKDVQGRMPSRPVLLNLINSLFHSFFTPSPLPFQVCVTLHHWVEFFFFF